MKKSISIKNLKFEYFVRSRKLIHLLLLKKQDQHKLVFENLELNIEKSEWVGIWGQNGKGKTTLAKLIAGVFLPSAGSIDIFEDYFVCTLRKMEIYQHEDIKTNIATIALLYSHRRLNQKDISEIFAIAEIESNKMHESVNVLSNGQHKRLLIALGIFLNRPAYLWDETFSNIDPIHAQKLLDKLKGKTNIFISHDEQFLRNNCSRIIEL